LLMLICSSAFLMVSCCFKVSGVTLRSLINFELILVQDERDIYMRISSFPQQTWTYKHLQVEHVDSIGTALWNLGEERKKRMMVNDIEILHIYTGRGHNYMYR
jgi:hypothetical protein